MTMDGRSSLSLADSVESDDSAKSSCSTDAINLSSIRGRISALTFDFEVLGWGCLSGGLSLKKKNAKQNYVNNLYRSSSHPIKVAYL